MISIASFDQCGKRQNLLDPDRSGPLSLSVFKHYDKTNIEDLFASMSQIDWSYLPVTVNVHELCSAFYETLYNIFHPHDLLYKYKTIKEVCTRKIKNFIFQI